MAAAALPFRPRDRAAHLPDADALVLADLHLGRGAAATLPLPDGVTDRLADLVERLDPTTVVLAGDVLHAFEHPDAATLTAFDALTDAVGPAALRIVAGNHDGGLDAVCDPVAELRLDDGTVVCHGHAPPELTGDRYVIGHDHPAIEVEGQRHPCFLYADAGYRGAAVIALPAFTPLAPGTAINRLVAGDLASPLLADLGRFAPVVRDEAADETYVFPALEAGWRHLRA